MYAENTPKVDAAIFDMGVPILGICYGHQFMAQTLGGKVASAGISEYGKTSVMLQPDCVLFNGLEERNICWMSHCDYVEEAPTGFKVVSLTDECPVAAMVNDERRLYGVQFHPEVEHTPFGRKMLSNFLFEICT